MLPKSIENGMLVGMHTSIFLKVPLPHLTSLGIGLEFSLCCRIHVINVVYTYVV